MQNNYRHEGSETDAFNRGNVSSRLQPGTYDGQIAGLYDLEDTLGRGHFAVVKLARHVFTGEKVAVKVIDKSKLDEISKAHLFQEIRCMKLVQHPNVVRLYEVIDTATKLYLVLELGDGGDLYEYILKYNMGLPEKVAKEYFRQIVKAIAYCHQLHVVHRDLKPENVVFFKKQGVVKLTDFGFSNKFYPGQKLETSCGSLAYSAPEILLGDSYEAPAVDIWSLGVILYMLVCGRPPFQEANDSETLTMIMDCKYDIPNHVSEECKRLISRMLIRNPEKRASLIEITGNSWLTDGKRTSLDMLPLVSKEQPSEEDQNFILQKMVNGDIATKEEILDCLEKNEYNHITATYYLLAERKLRSKRQQLTNRKRLEQVTASQNILEKSCSVKPLLLSVPRPSGDLPQRNRKCSIVQEDDEEEMSSCSRQENLGLPINRRGSRSEGRLNLTIQERIVEFERKRLTEKIVDENIYNYNNILKNTNNQPTITKNDVHSDICYVSAPSNRSYDQRKLKIQRTRTTSCSSSDTSDDDDNDKRKKEVHTLNISSKFHQTRRDSNDDSSDSQERGACSTSSGIRVGTTYLISCKSNRKTRSDEHDITQDSSKNRNKQSVIKEQTRTQEQKYYILNGISEMQDGILSSIFNISNTFTPKIKKIRTHILQDSTKSPKTTIKKRKRKYFGVQKEILPRTICKNIFYVKKSQISWLFFSREKVNAS